MLATINRSVSVQTRHHAHWLEGDRSLWTTSIYFFLRRAIHFMDSTQRWRVVLDLISHFLRSKTFSVIYLLFYVFLIRLFLFCRTFILLFYITWRSVTKWWQQWIIEFYSKTELWKLCVVIFQEFWKRNFSSNFLSRYPLLQPCYQIILTQWSKSKVSHFLFVSIGIDYYHNFCIFCSLLSCWDLLAFITAFALIFMMIVK